MHFLEAHNVVKSFTNHLALDNLNVSIPENCIYGLLGPNGAGKTTFIRIVNQITGPDKGEILFNGKPLQSKDISQIGYLPEERGLYKKMKVGEHALYLAQLKGLSKHEALSRLKYWFQKFEIEPWWGKKIEELSKGMQQKIQFIVTILHKPKLLIFDEPFSGFDPVNANILKKEILKLKKEGATIIFSTHNMDSVEQLCDNISLINNGKSVLEGKVNEIRQKYKNNIIKLEYAGDKDVTENLISKTSTIIKSESGNDEVQSLWIKNPESISVNDLLKNIIESCTIHSCSEILPGMDEVFIKVAGEKNI
ncbi:ATP-binding cassette domain-containing protein [Marinilabiliaceae bacterium ANBcel2]|nr:ATP-binding cassette domain-containing protein [Marinilabiliaceae bacterium ANBcel2]